MLQLRPGRIAAVSPRTIDASTPQACCKGWLVQPERSSAAWPSILVDRCLVPERAQLRSTYQPSQEGPGLGCKEDQRGAGGQQRRRRQFRPRRAAVAPCARRGLWSSSPPRRRSSGTPRPGGSPDLRVCRRRSGLWRLGVHAEGLGEAAP